MPVTGSRPKQLEPGAPGSPAPPSGQNNMRIAAGLVGFGVLIEICQRAVGYRSGEWLDVGADVIGIVIGLTIGLAGAGGWTQRFESRYLARGSEAGLD